MIPHTGSYDEPEPGGGRTLTTRERAWLVVVLIAAAALRIAGLSALPPGLHPDEAANAYEAWCLGKTGHASDGRALPLVFSHHGTTWTEGTYVWLAVPFVLCAGDRIEEAVRLPAALAGTGAVLATFLLARRVAVRLGCARPVRFALLAAAFLAFSPWAVHHARLAVSPTLEPLLLTAGLALGLAGIERRRSAATLAGGALLGLGLATYPPARIVVPLVALSLVLAARERRAWLLLAPVVAAGVALLPFAFSVHGLQHLRDIGVHGPFEAVHNYAVHFSSRTLLSGEVRQGFAAKGAPPIAACTVPFLLLGAWRATRGGRFGAWLLAWVLVSPLAAAFTSPAPNLLRAIFELPALAILFALGLDFVLAALARKAPGARRLVAAALGLVFAVGLGVAAFRYVAVFPGTANDWAPYESERARVEAARGDFDLTLPNERALVDLYARARPHRWTGPGHVVFD